MIKQTKSIVAALLAAGFLSLAYHASAGDTATQTVSFTVSAINELSVTGSPTLNVNTATAGVAPNAVVDTTATYAITTNEAGRKITGKIDAVMPAGVTLSITLDPTTGATSTGKQPLGTTAVDLVTGISNLNESGRAITYELGATSAAAVATGSRTVTLTVTAGS